MLRTLLALASVTVLAACAGAPAADDAQADIAKVLDVKSTFGPEFKVTSVGPAAIDPRLLASEAPPPGAVFDPADCAKVATGTEVPAGLQGKMASTTAEGNGNRFVAIAVETSEPLPVADRGDSCKKVAFAANGVRGLDEEIEAPTIDGARTIGTHRFRQTMAGNQVVGGELDRYVASFATFTVIVTANPLVEPGKAVAAIDAQRARDLLVAAVSAVRGS